MNKRIIKLVELSYYECPQVTSYQWENNIVPPEQWAKFAELIVKKCCEILNDKRFNNVRPSIEVAQAMMKEYFEIK